MKYALISGGNGGLAEEVINLLINSDYKVFALDKDPKLIDEYANNELVTPFNVDITNDEEIIKVKDYLINNNLTLDLIINFAGIVILGSTLEVNPSKALTLMNINLMGTYRINYYFKDFIIKSKGRIINLSSEYGDLCAIPFHSFYTMSKRAIEVYNDSLRREVSHLGVKVIKIRPGSFKTNMQSNVENQFNELVKDTKLFKNPLMKMKMLMVKELDKAKTTKKIVHTFKKAIFKKKPKRVYNVHRSIKMKILSILPEWMIDLIFKLYF